jgi:hypothetical protein
MHFIVIVVLMGIFNSIANVHSWFSRKSTFVSKDKTVTVHTILCKSFGYTVNTLQNPRDIAWFFILMGPKLWCDPFWRRYVFYHKVTINFGKEFPYNICDCDSVHKPPDWCSSKVVVYVYCTLLSPFQSSVSLVINLLHTSDRLWNWNRTNIVETFLFLLQYNGIPLHFSHSPSLPFEK